MKLFLIWLILFVSFVVTETLKEGDTCNEGGTPGVCANIKICQSAIENVKKNIDPEVCSFNGVEPIVCCFDDRDTLLAQLTSATTAKTVEINKISMDSQITNTGESCQQESKSGICIHLKRCQSAIEDLKKNIRPQICSFDGREPIVCCFDEIKTSSEFEERRFSISEYTKDVDGICQISSFHMSRTGKKALDKCIQYQEQFVYPCDIRVPETGELARGNRCYHDDKEFTEGTVNPAENDFLHMVLVGNEIEWKCGGTLISDKFILTAGQCILHRKLREEGPLTHVAVGIFRREDSKQPINRYDIEETFIHPDYHTPSSYNDIALVKTEKFIQLNQFVVPACLDDGGTEEVLTVAGTGWGYRHWNDSILATELKKSVQLVGTKDECSKLVPPSRLHHRNGTLDTQMCHRSKNETAFLCAGDAGGPLQVKSKKISCMYVVVGIISYGTRCGSKNEISVATRVSKYLDWIESIVWPN